MIVFITGASRGIGKSIAEIFAKNNCQLILTSKSHNNLQATVQYLQNQYAGLSIAAKAFDISQKQQVAQLCQWVLSIGTPQIVINNAGEFLPGKMYNEADGILEAQIATNLYSAYYTTRGLLPDMMQNGKGHIFNICSVASLMAYENGGAYSISKFALNGFSKNLREEMKPFGIKVTSVFPGAVYTDSWSGFDNSLGRIMEATDIAQLVFAASQLSPQACVEDITVRPLLGDL